MQTSATEQPLRGIVEVDEAFIGGKGAQETRYKRHVPVVAMIQREAGARAKALPDTRTGTILKAMRRHVHLSSTLMTDEAPMYESIGGLFPRHLSVTHSEGEYARGGAHTNTVESFFALFKRGIHGSYHHVSRKHLTRYCEEFAFRWTWRERIDEDRSKILLGNSLQRTPIRLAELTNGNGGGYKRNVVVKG